MLLNNNKVELHNLAKIENLYFSFRFKNKKIISFLLQTQKRIKNINVGDNFRYLRRMDENIFFKKFNTFQCKQMWYKKIKLCPIKNTNKASYVDNNINLQNCEAIQQLALYGCLDVEAVNSNLASLRTLKILALNSLRVKSTKFQLKKVLQNNTQLHTFSMVGISALVSLSKVVQDLTFLSRYQLKHLKLSALKSQRIIYVDLSLLRYHINIETLILINLNFQGGQNTSEQSIKSFNKLVYLNLYGCGPIYSDFVEGIHSDCRSTLKVINLGCTYIDQKVVRWLSMFKNLESLCLDYTDLNPNDLLKITQNMAKLRNLSIFGLKEQTNPEIKRNLYLSQIYSGRALICFQSMKYKNLRYVNVYLSAHLTSYDWRSFKFLEVLRVNDVSLLNKNIREILEKRGVIVIDSTEQQVDYQSISQASLQYSLVEANYHGGNQISGQIQETENLEIFKRENQSHIIL